MPNADNIIHFPCKIAPTDESIQKRYMTHLKELQLELQRMSEFYGLDIREILSDLSYITIATDIIEAIPNNPQR